ncbi:hypothetical protein [Alteraurantiacibacter buctensis]|uniref:Uncharacterized protein n=1 Tax=Alteraurantiacibacter buctensis TaxID=1503981 RepID=A0A844YZR5_9SPHN|nr:hypothetical protein [Alteraurantiacibacter buctensis]MXO72506.1 hypothetical protein [Alteraurantiacibacter buctensis]
MRLIQGGEFRQDFATDHHAPLQRRSNGPGGEGGQAAEQQGNGNGDHGAYSNLGRLTGRQSDNSTESWFVPQFRICSHVPFPFRDVNGNVCALFLPARRTTIARLGWQSAPSAAKGGHVDQGCGNSVAA